MFSTLSHFKLFNTVFIFHCIVEDVNARPGLLANYKPIIINSQL